MFVLNKDSGTSVSVASTVSDMLEMRRLGWVLSFCFIASRCCCTALLHVPFQCSICTSVDCCIYVCEISDAQDLQAAEWQRTAIRGADNAWQQPHAWLPHDACAGAQGKGGRHLQMKAAQNQQAAADEQARRCQTCSRPFPYRRWQQHRPGRQRICRRLGGATVLLVLTRAPQLSVLKRQSRPQLCHPVRHVVPAGQQLSPCESHCSTGSSTGVLQTVQDCCLAAR